MYQTILFDLDGTLTDPGIGITNAVMYALKQFGIEVKERSTLFEFIGPPLKDSFESLCGFSSVQSEQAIKHYRTYYKKQGIFEADVYQGIEEVLIELKEKGKILVVATSKPEVFAVEVLKHFGLDQYFDVIAGATMDETRNTKGAVIAYALEKVPAKDKSEIIMVGDRKHDILGAKENDIDSLGVCYGYGTQEEIEKAQPTYIAKEVKNLLKYLLI